MNICQLQSRLPSSEDQHTYRYHRRHLLYVTNEVRELEAKNNTWTHEEVDSGERGSIPNWEVKYVSKKN